VITMEEEVWDESNIREFAKLVEQYEQTWEPDAEELETINVGNDQIERELKIGTLITSKKKSGGNCPTTRIYKCFCLVLQGYAWFG